MTYTRPATAAKNGDRPRVALLPWGDIFVDWLDRLGVSLDVFTDRFVGSWMFGYAAALQRAGVDTVLVCITRRVEQPLRLVHRPTGATLWVLPAPQLQRIVRPHALFERLDGRRDPRVVARAGLAHLAPYFATPPFALARVLRAEGCSALLCQEYETPRFDVSVVLGKLLGLPAFGTFQGGDYQSSRLEGPVRPLTLRAATGIIVAPRAEADRVRFKYGLPERKVARIFNPVDTDRWRPRDRAAAREDLGISQAAQVVVWHGQVQRWRKGLDVLLEAWRLLNRERGYAERLLLLVGAGEDAARIRAEAPEGVRLLDRWVADPDELARLLAVGDVYAFPSRHEGLPVSPVEALACGLPVVAADAHGVSDILERGERDGGIVVPRDDARTLARELRRLLDDGERRSVLAAAARRRAEEAFSLDAIGAQLRAFLFGRRPEATR